MRFSDIAPTVQDRRPTYLISGSHLVVLLSEVQVPAVLPIVPTLPPHPLTRSADIARTSAAPLRLRDRLLPRPLEFLDAEAGDSHPLLLLPLPDRGRHALPVFRVRRRHLGLRNPVRNFIIL